MKRILLTTAAALLLNIDLTTAAPNVSKGKLLEYPQFKSEYVSPRDIWVWVPEDYSPKKKYDVLYMHDGQMLFDAATTWNKQEWKIDETVGQLIEEGKINPCIVVGIANIAATRYGDYFPQKTLQWLPEGTSIPKDTQFNADNYLRFLVKVVPARPSSL